jgi:hypothetical protein
MGNMSAVGIVFATVQPERQQLIFETILQLVFKCRKLLLIYDQRLPQQRFLKIPNEQYTGLLEIARGFYTAPNDEWESSRKKAIEITHRQEKACKFAGKILYIAM